VARLSLEVRREKIVDAMIEQILEHGIAATRVTDVAKAMGISSGLIFYYFETKEALLAAAFPKAMARDLADLETVVTSDEPVADRLRKVISIYGPAGDAAGWRLWIDGWAASLRDDQLAGVIQEVDVHWRSAVQTLVEEGVAEGVFTCPDPEATTARITTLLDGLAVQSLVRRQGFDSGRQREWVDWLLVHELGLPPERG
jgi:AcrR family transcriptional regulator